MAWVAGVLAGVSVVVVVTVAPEGLRASSDPGAPTIAYWSYLLPVARFPHFSQAISPELAAVSFRRH